MKKIQKGFTLIELLIVIAIIGILAGVILVSTNTARTKAFDANFKKTASTLRTAIMAYCISNAAATEATVRTAIPAVGELSYGSTVASSVANSGCAANGTVGTIKIKGSANTSTACSGTDSTISNGIITFNTGC